MAQPKVDVGTDRETIISIVLGAIVVIVIGALAFRYFRDNPADTTGNDANGQQMEQVVEVKELPSNSEIEYEDTDEGQVPSSLPVKYTVQPGDSTWKIAEAFYGSGFNYVDIEQENSLAADQELDSGMELIIPKVPVRSADQAGTPRDVTAQEGEMPEDQVAGPSKGDDSAAQELMQ